MMKLLPVFLIGVYATFCCTTVLPVANGQFACTFSGASDEGSCLTAEDDSDQHCVWCALSTSSTSNSIQINSSTTTTTMTTTTNGGDLGVCVSEAQAETMEQTIPDLVRCNRYSGTDDATPPSADDDYTPTDDTAPASDDAAPPTTDDAAPPNTDDKVVPPDDDDDVYWKCPMLKTVSACQAKEACTWCDTPVGYGVCMSGPSAAAAETSKWFTCQHPNSTSIFSTTTTILKSSSATNMVVTTDPLDPSCALVYVQDPTKDACEAAVDSDGTPCEFCNFKGTALQVCLNADQAALGEQYGLTCGGGDDDEDIITTTSTATTISNGDGDELAVAAAAVQDIMDPSCAILFLQDPSPNVCLAAVDADGNPCQFCTLPGAFTLCLNADQAAMGVQFGFECGDDTIATNTGIMATANVVAAVTLQDPRDPSCTLVYLQNPTKDVCKAAVDINGNPCEFCTLQDSLSLCLNVDQAAIGEQYGLECDDATEVVELQDPLDPSCALVYLQDPSKEACEAAVDADGNACQFCNLQGAFELCLNADQAAMGEQFGLECGDDADESTSVAAATATTRSTTVAALSARSGGAVDAVQTSQIS